MRRTLRDSIGIISGIVVVAAMAAFVTMRVVASSRSLDAALLREHALEACIAVVAFMLAVLALGFSWSILLRAASGRAGTRGRVRLLTISSLTWLGRYVPGTLPFLAGRVYVTARAGYGKRPATIATGLQAVIEVLAASAIGVAAFGFARWGVASAQAWCAAVAVALLAVVAIHPRAIAFVSSAGRRVLRRGVTLDGVALPDRRAVVASGVWVCACQLLTIAGVVAAASAVTTVSTSDVPAIAAAVTLSGVAGVLVVLAPAGLGVRDGAFVALLLPVMPVEAAASVAVAYRALTVASDLLLAVLAVGFDRVAAFTRAPRPTLPESRAAEQRA